MIDTLIALIVLLGSLAGIAGLVLGLLVQLQSPQSPIVEVTGDTILSPSNCNKTVLFTVANNDTQKLVMPQCQNGSTMQLEQTLQSAGNTGQLDLQQSDGTTRVMNSNSLDIYMQNGLVVLCNSNENQWICVTLGI